MAVLVNPETGQAFEVGDDEADDAIRSMGLSRATPDQVSYLERQKAEAAKPITQKAFETGRSFVRGAEAFGGEVGKLIPADPLGIGPGMTDEEERIHDEKMRSRQVFEDRETHPIAFGLGAAAPTMAISGGLGGGLVGMGAESAVVGLSGEAIDATQQNRDFDLGLAGEGAATDLAFSAAAAAASKVVSRVGNLLLFGGGNTMARNMKRGFDSSGGPVVADDVRFEGPLLEAETRSTRAAKAAAPGMPPGPERDEMLRRAAPDLNQQVVDQGGDMFDATADAARKSVAVGESDAIRRRVDDYLTETTPAQTSWSADATRRLDSLRASLDAVGNDPVAAQLAARARAAADEAIAAIDGSGDSAAWFTASGRARAKLDDLSDEIANVDLPSGSAIAGVVDDARAFLDRSLSDRSLFGKAAEMHAGITGAARDQIGAATRAAGGDLRGQLSAFVAADAVERAAMRGPLEQAIEGFEDLARQHERFGTATPRQIELLQSNAATLRKGLTLADDVQGAAGRSAERARTAPKQKAAPAEPDFARAESIAEKVRTRVAEAGKRAGAKAAKGVVDYAAGPGSHVYNEAVDEVLRNGIMTGGAALGASMLGGLVGGPAGLVGGFLVGRKLGAKYSPQVAKAILETAQRFVKKHGADTAGAALLASAAFDDSEESDTQSAAASMGGLLFARRFAKRAIQGMGEAAGAAGKGVYKASEAITGAVDTATGKATDALARGTYAAGRAVGETAGSGVDAVARVAADEARVRRIAGYAVRGAMSGTYIPFGRAVRGEAAQAAGDFLGPRISKAAISWLEKRAKAGKTAAETVDEAVAETAQSAKREPLLLPEHTEQAVSALDDMAKRLDDAMKETPAQAAKSLAAFPKRLSGSAKGQREALMGAVDELVAGLSTVTEAGSKEAAESFAKMARQAITGARTAQDRFRIGMQLTETLADHTARVGDGEMSKVLGAYTERMWETMGQRELWLGERELGREAKRRTKQRELLLSYMSDGEKIGIAAVAGAAALADDDDSGASMAAAGGLALLGGSKLGTWKVGRELVNLSRAADPIATLKEMGAKPALIERAAARLDAASRPLSDAAVSPKAHAAAAERNEAIWTPAERDAVSEYQSEGYRDVNAQLRGKPSGADANIAAITSALDKAVGSGNVAPGVIWRGVDLDAKQLDQLEQSSHVMAQGVLSAGTTSEAGRVFAPGEYGKTSVLFKIEQKTGVPVSESGESELLMRPGTKFEIVGIDRVKYEGGPYVKEGGWRYIDTIELREVGQVPEKARRAFFRQHGGKLAAGGGIVALLGDDEDSGAAMASTIGLGALAGKLGRKSQLGSVHPNAKANPGGLTPSMLADAKRGSWNPTEAPSSSVSPSSLTPDEQFTAQGRATRSERAVRPTQYESDRQRGYVQSEGRLADNRGDRIADNARAGALGNELTALQKAGLLSGAGVAGGLALEGTASAAESDPRLDAANRIVSVDAAATGRIRHTARVLSGLAEPPVPAGLTTSLARFGAEHDDPWAAFEDRKAILETAEVSPELVYDVIGSTLGDVASVSPELYQAVSARVLDGFRYMRENLPAEVKSSLVHPRGVPPSQSAMRDWATQWSAVMDPESVLDDIENGTVTNLQIRTLQAAHPDTYQQLRTEIIAEVGANFADIPTSTKMQLDILFQADGLAGPMFSSAAAVMIGEASKAASKQKQPMPQGSESDGDAVDGARGLSAIASSVTNRGV